MNFKEIPVEYQPAYTWLWNSKITKEEIKRQIDEMYESGIRAFYVLGEPEHFRPNRRRTHLSPEYLSEEYIDLVYYAYEVAAGKGMYTWLYNEGGFPSGMICGQIRKEHPELAMKTVESRKMQLASGEAFIAPPNLIAAFAEQRVHPGTVFSEETELTLYLQADDTNDLNLLRTDNGSLRNTEIFLKLTHEKLKKRFGEHMGTDITMMFDDEAYMGFWSDGLAQIFMERYGYDIGDFMPVIKNEIVPQTEEEYRAKSDYIMLCGELVRENYFKAMRVWLNANHMLSVGHLDNDNVLDQGIRKRYGNVMQTLREFDVPGIDVIWSQIDYPQNGKSCLDGYEFFPRLASSAARQQGHSRCLSESFAVYGAHVTPELMRYVVNYQAVQGISLYNFMVISYDRKTAMSLQYRPNFIVETPGMDCLSQINDYTARLSYILQQSKAAISTALYFPFRSVCAGDEKGSEAMKEMEAIGQMLTRKGISFDVIDEAFVRTASVKDGRLAGEHVIYDNVFVPEAAFEPEDVMEKLKRLGQTVLSEDFPADCFGSGKVAADIERKNPAIAARKLSFKDGSEGYFICNTAGETVCETIGLPFGTHVDGNPYIVDLHSGDLYKAEYTVEGNLLRLPINLLRGEGLMVWLTDEVCETAGEQTRLEKVCDITDIKSYVSRKYEIHPQDGPRNFYYDCGEEREGLYEWSKDFSGEVTYTCVLPELPKESEETCKDYILDLGEVRYYAKIYLNDSKAGEVTMPPYRVPLKGAKAGDELKIVIANTIANACSNTAYFDLQDIRDVGPYHSKMILQEAKAPAGGLLGPVAIYIQKK